MDQPKRSIYRQSAMARYGGEFRVRAKRTATIAVSAAMTLGLVAGCGAAVAEKGGSSSGDTVYFGVSAPVSGQYAEYGRLWKQGLDLALDKVNAEGGVNGKKVDLKWEDSQSDPKQTVPIAQKFLADTSVIAELGDFSSPASMAASPTYTAGKLVQYGFTNSHPDFTKSSEYTWSPSLTQPYLQSQQARIVAKYAKNIAVVYQQTDWGKTAFTNFSASAQQLGLNITYSSAFLPDSTDFRPILIKARDSNPDAVVHLGYGPDGALIVKQLRDVGFSKGFFGGQNTAEFIKLAGSAAEGDVITGAFLASDPSPAVQEFVTAYKKKYPNESPGDFNVYAYDALIDLVHAAKNGGATRDGVLQGLKTTTDLPSIQFGSFKFDDQRRPDKVQLKDLLLQNGQFVLNSQPATVK